MDGLFGVKVVHSGLSALFSDRFQVPVLAQGLPLWFASAVKSMGFTEFTGWLDVKSTMKALSYLDIPCVVISDPKLFFCVVSVVWGS